MKEELKQYSSTITKKHVFAWSPKYKESFNTRLRGKRLVAVILEAISDLGWLLHYRKEEEILVQTKQKFNRYEVIRISFSTGRIEVESKSTGNEFWDMGRNSKWVKLFIYAFTTIEKSYSKTDLKGLEEDLIKQDNWDDYKLPNQLPKPVKRIKPTFWIPLIGGLVIAISIAATFAMFTSNGGGYIVFLFDVLTGLAIGFTFKYLIRWGNYINGDRLIGFVVTTSILSFCFYQYFSFLFIDTPFSNVRFIDFIINRFTQGMVIESIKLGSWAVVLQWVIQLVLPIIIAYFLMITSLVKYIAERVPQEVIDFTYYHLKNKTEVQVRNELSKMGWITKESQDEVFMALEAINTSEEIKVNMF